MSQHDFNIANQTFPSFRSDLNNALVAAATMSAGSSAPTTPYAYQLWFDTTTGTWKVRNSGNTAWVSTITTDLATGNVGIGTDSPNEKVTSSNGFLSIGAVSTTARDGAIVDYSGTVGRFIAGRAGGNYGQWEAHVAGASGVTKRYQIDYDSTTRWYAANGTTEHMRIDSSGRILIGKTVADSIGTDGIELDGANDRVLITRSNSEPLVLNRKTSDGDSAIFRKDGTTVGSIGVYGGRIYFGNVADSGISFYQFSLTPTNAGGLAVDNTYDCGHSIFRWDDVYATNGTIQTSDQNEKQQIAALTDAEITAAKAISALFKTFKWNSAVEAKGDAARTHAGVIAQDIEAAMTAAGLDAGDYAFFISSTWWEKQTEVPAVEADEENGVEAQEAYTRTDTYNTAEEAPEGATERTRLGIRYPELLAFVGAATEQRLASIETRLTALEA